MLVFLDSMNGEHSFGFKKKLVGNVGKQQFGLEEPDWFLPEKSSPYSLTLYICE